MIYIILLIIFILILMILKEFWLPILVVGITVALIIFICKCRSFTKEENRPDYVPPEPEESFKGFNVSSPQQSARARRNRYKTVPISTFRTKVRGVTFNNDKGIPIQGILRDLSGFEEITLEREPHNPYDSDAIAVFADNVNIGHLSADIAAMYSPDIDNRKILLEGRITQITGGSGLSYGCNLEITVYKII